MNSKKDPLSGTVGFITAAIIVLLIYSGIFDARVARYLADHDYYFDALFYSILRMCVNILAIIFLILAGIEIKWAEDKNTNLKLDINSTRLDARDAKKDIKRLEERIAELEKKLGEKNGIS